MKIRTLLSTLLAMFATFAMAQVESGKVYRFVNKLYGTCAFESVADHTVKCSNIGTTTDYEQMWIVTETDVETNYTIQNVYTGRYLSFQNATNNPFTTIADVTYLYINDNSSLFEGCYTFTASKGSSWAMHCASSATCVPWNTSAEATNWTFQEVSITAEEIAAAQEIYKNFSDVVENETEIATAFEAFFDDKACTTLKAEYAAMSDDELSAAMTSLPADLQAVALKIKNNTWNEEKREKEFRIYDYKPYSNCDTWASILFTKAHSPINNPTGISTLDNKSYLYVFVDQIPEGTFINLGQCTNTFPGSVVNTTLHEGLNVVPVAATNSSLFVRYICETAVDGKKLADYPAVKVHIENGYVNGFWSKERGHTNDDWVYMQQYMFENPEAIQVVGDHTILNFCRDAFLSACPEKITEVLNLWDFWNAAQRKYMAIDKYYDWFNNKQLAASSEDGYFMYASSYYTHYANYTLSSIVNYETISTDGGSAWGPNHEIGHTNQAAFQIVGTSEVSNNGLANFAIFDVGTHTSRGNDLENQILDFENKIPYVVRGEKEYGQKLFSMTRMYFQLFLYAHAAGKCPDFYPRLFERLRYDRLVGWTTGSFCAGTGDCSEDPKNENGYVYGSMDAKDDQLKFAEICCEILQMDLSEFFEAWGFFIPMKNAFVGDYGHHHVYLHQEDIDASKARMQQYEKKGGHLMFLEDRVRPSLRKDGTGYRVDYSSEVPVGTVGDFGQWEDYIDETVKAQGYYYTYMNGRISIVEDEGAGGALGFKLYNADTGELLTFTNRKSMTVPMAARASNLKVVAAQADGTDYIVPNASEGPEEMQKLTLKNSITQAKRITGNISTSGDEVGKYYSDAATTLSNLVEAAVADSASLEVHSATEWSAMLDEEYNNVLNNKKARVLMKEGVTYYMYNASKKAYYLTWSASGVNGAKDKTVEAAHWMLEYTGVPDTYYLKCANGMYIASVTEDGIAGNAYTPAYAATFNIGYTDNSRTYITLSDNGNSGIAFDSSAYGTLAAPTETKAQWYVRVLEDNSAEFESQELAALMEKSCKILVEVSDTAKLAGASEAVINTNIVATDVAFRDNVMNLYEVYTAVQKDYDNTDEYYFYIADLRAALLNVEGKYSVKSPVVANDGYFYWYVIRSEITDKVWNNNDTDTNLRVTLVESETADATDNMLWALVPSETAGEYNFVNAASQTPIKRYYLKDLVAQSTYTLSTSGTKSSASPITLSYNAETGYSVIYTGDGSAAVDNGSATLLQYKTNATSGWKFELVAIEKNDELYEALTAIGEIVVESDDVKAASNDTYDLFGRKVLAPVKNNIYIKNGEKVIIK